MPARTINLTLKEAKKHSVRYDAPTGAVDPMITSLYVMKSSLPQPWPSELEVAISWPAGVPDSQIKEIL